MKKIIVFEIRINFKKNYYISIIIHLINKLI